MSRPENHPPGKNIGQGMLIASFTLVLIALTLYFNDWLAEQSNPNQNPNFSISDIGVREVVLERNRQGHYIANGQLNEIPVTFLLDTGATEVAVPSGVADKAGLIRGLAQQASTANGVVTVFSTEIDELRIGNIVLYDIEASVTPSMLGNTILLGMSALRQIEFTQRGSNLTLSQVP
ncbi:MAG: TIGR02281 family clan AA aspartic protease [Pseudohongiellaceae bacterium]